MLCPRPPVSVNSVVKRFKHTQGDAGCFTFFKQYGEHVLCAMTRSRGASMTGLGAAVVLVGAEPKNKSSKLGAAHDHAW